MNPTKECVHINLRSDLENARKGGGGVGRHPLCKSTLHSPQDESGSNLLTLEGQQGWGYRNVFRLKAEVKRFSFSLF